MILFQKQPPEVKKALSKSLATFTGKRLCWSLILLPGYINVLTSWTNHDYRRARLVTYNEKICKYIDKKFSEKLLDRYGEIRAKLNSVYRLTVYDGNSSCLLEQNCWGKFCHTTNFYCQTLRKIRRKKLLSSKIFVAEQNYLKMYAFITYRRMCIYVYICIYM